MCIFIKRFLMPILYIYIYISSYYNNGVLKFPLVKDEMNRKTENRKNNYGSTGNGADFQDETQFCTNFSCLGVLCW